MQATLVRGATIKLVFGRIQQSRDAVDVGMPAAMTKGRNLGGDALGCRACIALVLRAYARIITTHAFLASRIRQLICCSMLALSPPHTLLSLYMKCSHSRAFGGNTALSNLEKY
jgi:hypothetical protein